jgi:hypothetical protein
MRRAQQISIVFASLVFFMVGYSFGQSSSSSPDGQSLGDVARQQRQKQQQQTKDTHAPAHKVITDEDIPDHPDTFSATPSSENKPETSSFRPSSENSEQAGAQWKARILAQKNAIASFQSQIDNLNSSVHFVEASILSRPIVITTGSSTTSARCKSRKKCSACNNNWTCRKRRLRTCKKARARQDLAARCTTRRRPPKL